MNASIEETIDLVKLTRWMDEKNLTGGDIENLQTLSGGTQNILVRFKRGGRSFVLRRPPTHPRKNSNETIRREARVLAAIADSRVPHPRLIADCPEEDLLGVSFYLMEAVEGFTATDGLKSFHLETPGAGTRMCHSLVEAISELGQLDYQALGLSGFGKPEGFLERQVSRWQRHLDSYSSLEGYKGPNIPGVNDTADWLDRNMPPKQQPGIIHGDYHLGNIMFRNHSPEVAAVVDWELSTIGDPLIDLGWLMATWPVEKGDTAFSTHFPQGFGFLSSEELVSHYGRINSRDLTHMNWYAVLACYKLGIILEGTHARACAGKAPRETGDMLHAMTLQLFERALNWIS